MGKPSLFGWVISTCSFPWACPRAIQCLEENGLPHYGCFMGHLKYNAAAVDSRGAPTHTHPVTRGAVLPPGSPAVAPRGRW